MSNNQLPADLQERIKADALLARQQRAKYLHDKYEIEGYEDGYIAGATAMAERAQNEIDRRNKLLEDDLKRQCRLNMPGISEQDQESAWQAFKTKHNL